MLSSSAHHDFKLEEIIKLPTLEETPNLFQPLEKINNHLGNLKGDNLIKVLNEKDVTQFTKDFENHSVNEEEKQINKIKFERFVNKRDQISFHSRPSFLGKGLEQRQWYTISTKFKEESIYV